MGKTAATIREEQELDEQIAKAHAFSAFLLFGPHDRRKYVVEEGGAFGYQCARKAADLMNDEARAQGSTRQAIVYAINKLGSFDVSPEAARRLGLI